LTTIISAALRLPPRLGGDVSGIGIDGGEDAVAFAAGDFEVSGLEGDAVAFFGACVGVEGEVDPPSSVVFPDVVVGVGVGATGGKVEGWYESWQFASVQTKIKSN